MFSLLLILLLVLSVTYVLSGFPTFLKKLFVDLIVNPGNVLKFPNLMALSHVAFIGNPAHACRYSIVFYVLCSLYKLLMDCLRSMKLISMVSKFSFSNLGFNGTFHNPLVFHLYPVNIACTDTLNFNPFPL